MNLKTYNEEPDDDEPDEVRDQEHPALAVSVSAKCLQLQGKTIIAPKVKYTW